MNYKKRTMLRLFYGIVMILIATSLIIIIPRIVFTGNAIYELGNFDGTTPLEGWTQGGSSSNGDFTSNSPDKVVYYSGDGSLKGKTIAGAGVNWSGEYMEKTLPINRPSASDEDVWLSFRWRKSYENNESENNMTMVLVSPDGQVRILWNNEQQTWNSWNVESMNIDSHFNQYGTYKIRLLCEIKTLITADNNSTGTCWYDGVIINVVNVSSVDGGINPSPQFYNYYENPQGKTEYSEGNIITLSASVANSDGKVWLDIGGLNRTTNFTGGLTYEYKTASLGAGNYSYHYWGWSPSISGSLKSKGYSEIRNYEVTKAKGTTEILLNNQLGNITVNNGTSVCIKATTKQTGGLRTLYIDDVSYSSAYKDYQNCTTFQGVGTRSIKLIWEGNQNYTSAEETKTITITNKTIIVNYEETPIIILESPIIGEYAQGTKVVNIGVRITTTMNRCEYKMNDKEYFILDKEDSTHYSKKGVAVSPGINKITITCEDQNNNKYSLFEKEFSIKKLEFENLTFSNVTETCTPSPKCTEWTFCRSQVYDFGELLKGTINTKGERQRICMDDNKCFEPQVVREDCDLTIPIKTVKTEHCGETYVEVYDLQRNSLVSRLKEKSLESGTRKLDVRFILQSFSDYCNYCYDDVKNYDEEGIDCGGPNCPSCNPVTHNRRTPNLLLTILEIIGTTILLSGIYYWIFLKGSNNYTEKKPAQKTEIKKSVIKTKKESGEHGKIHKKAEELIVLARKKGYSDEQIKEILTKKGWTHEEIRHLFEGI